VPDFSFIKKITILLFLSRRILLYNRAVVNRKKNFAGVNYEDAENNITNGVVIFCVPADNQRHSLHRASRASGLLGSMALVGILEVTMGEFSYQPRRAVCPCRICTHLAQPKADCKLFEEKIEASGYLHRRI